MANINVNFEQEVGKIKPLNGVNAGPKTRVFTYDTSEYFKEANISYSRLHDVEYPYGSGEFVDIHCIFPNFDADVNDPASYKFGNTDCYIKAILDCGTNVIYRLGESIEKAPYKYYIYPPKDYVKWAQICEHIVMHYNEGWADGHHWNIEYWEIWNEPDGDTDKPLDARHATWFGNREQFFDFYATVSCYLKKRFPNIKIGGPSLSSKVDWTEDFMSYMKMRLVPLDFFSWHCYTASVEQMVKKSAVFQEILVKNGYPEAELIIGEWNYVESWSHLPRSFRKMIGCTGAAFCAAYMIALQHTANTIATYFEADVIKEWCGIFQIKDFASGEARPGRDNGQIIPRKPFYAFKAFGHLLQLGIEVSAECADEGVYTCAAKNGVEEAIMIATYESGIQEGISHITITGLPQNGCKIRIYLTDDGNDEVLEEELICHEEICDIPMRMIDEQIRFISITKL